NLQWCGESVTGGTGLEEAFPRSGLPSPRRPCAGPAPVRSVRTGVVSWCAQGRLGRRPRGRGLERIAIGSDNLGEDRCLGVEVLLPPGQVRRQQRGEQLIETVGVVADAVETE